VANAVIAVRGKRRQTHSQTLMKTTMAATTSSGPFA
jgi:hypothetical protein